MRPLRVLRTVALAVFLALVLAPVARAADPIMPLDQVHAGMRCTGLTVVHGVDIASFDVDVIDVVAGQPPEDPRILIRVSGPTVEGTGVAEGFSGSPVYCAGEDGVKRNVGAVSETVGQFGETVALVTPIEQMLGVPSDPPVNPRYAPALLRKAKPLRGVLTVSGVSARLGRALQDAARRSNRAFLAVPPGPLGSYPPQTIVPGASLAAGYSTGDIALAAVGTATYTDGDLVYAFGHPFDAVGRRGLLLEDAYVYTVIGNPLDIENATSYKYAAPGHALGTLSDDAPNGVVGHLGTLPDTAALTVNATDVDNGTQRTVSAQAARRGERRVPDRIVARSCRSRSWVCSSRRRRSSAARPPARAVTCACAWCSRPTTRRCASATATSCRGWATAATSSGRSRRWRPTTSTPAWG